MSAYVSETANSSSVAAPAVPLTVVALVGDVMTGVCEEIWRAATVAEELLIVASIVAFVMTGVKTRELTPVVFESPLRA